MLVEFAKYEEPIMENDYQRFQRRSEARVDKREGDIGLFTGDCTVRVFHRPKQEFMIYNIHDLLIEYNSGIDFDILAYNMKDGSIVYDEITGVFLISSTARVYKMFQTQNKNLYLKGRIIEVLEERKSDDFVSSKWSVGSLITPMASILTYNDEKKETEYVQNWMFYNLNDMPAVYQIETKEHFTIFINDILIRNS